MPLDHDHASREIARSILARFRRALLLIAAVSAAWALVVWLSEGFVLRAGPLRLASRSPVNPAALALLAFVAAFSVPVSDRWRSLRDDLTTWAHPAFIVTLAGIGLLVLQWAHARPLWLDEEMIALNIRERPLAELAHGLWLGQSAPFGWIALQRAAMLTIGDGERALRLVPLAFAIATLVAAAVIARRSMSVWGGVVLVLLCSSGQWLSYYSLELKHYSADIFWALVLPAAGAWVLEAKRERTTLAALSWWCAAAIGQYFANGALLVTPGCALVIVTVLARRSGGRAAIAFALGGTVWLAAFAVNYLVSIRHALDNAFLERYWTFAFPPAGAGVVGTVGWILDQLAPLAVKPGGSTLAWGLWLGAAAGFAFGRRGYLGALFASVPLAAFVLSALRLVPLYERLALWIVPSLYVGLALLLEVSVEEVRVRPAVRRWPRLLLAAAAGVLTLATLSNIIERGIFDVRHGRPPDSNHQLDDRSAVHWLMSQRRPGDVLLSTHLALPAIWWYGRVPIGDGTDGGRRTADGTRIVEASYRPPGPDCRRQADADPLAGAQRMLVYLGFRFDDVPAGFDELLLARLRKQGEVSAVRDFTSMSRAVIVEARTNPVGPASPALPGCTIMAPARRW